ncbi:hypothetical protein K2224_19790 [Streptomyces sp. BHT-5-2]|uniref:hypothetical protein n=1 Tax=unclassified Streptomyces TaxID=2593676 RepID=UPI001C8D8168|nr:hypothetical protein [Streptomyces sp. BHT-5-2]QZL05105.1 hypothetical protein K2224_19790 [Streptomyces sp. BHT-5-2]
MLGDVLQCLVQVLVDRLGQMGALLVGGMSAWKRELSFPRTIQARSRARPASMICGQRSPTSELSITLARIRCRSRLSISRQMPTRGP